MLSTTGNTYNYMKLNAQQGWQCPLCSRIFGPFVQECLYCNKREYTLNSTIRIGENNEKIYFVSD